MLVIATMIVIMLVEAACDILEAPLVKRRQDANTQKLCDIGIV